MAEIDNHAALDPSAHGQAAVALAHNMGSVSPDEHHEAHEEEHSHHWLTTYVFSQDHKTIAKQFLITGLLWAFVGGAMSMIFRLQLGFPNADLSWLKPILGGWVENGKIDQNFYLALVTMHGTIMVFFVLTGRIERAPSPTSSFLSKWAHATWRAAS